MDEGEKVKVGCAASAASGDCRKRAPARVAQDGRNEAAGEMKAKWRQNEGKMKTQKENNKQPNKKEGNERVTNE